MTKKGMDRPKQPKVLKAGPGGPNGKGEKPISGAYSTIDTDLARDNLENDIPAADLEDL